MLVAQVGNSHPVHLSNFLQWSTGCPWRSPGALHYELICLSLQVGGGNPHCTNEVHKVNPQVRKWNSNSGLWRLCFYVQDTSSSRRRHLCSPNGVKSWQLDQGSRLTRWWRLKHDLGEGSGSRERVPQFKILASCFCIELFTVSWVLAPGWNSI